MLLVADVGNTNTKIGVFDASLITGAIALPIVVPRPVVKTTTVAPEATSPGVDS